jgi:hypothetical protein
MPEGWDKLGSGTAAIGRSGMGKVMGKHHLNSDYPVISMIFGGLRLRQFSSAQLGSFAMTA